MGIEGVAHGHMKMGGLIHSSSCYNLCYSFCYNSSSRRKNCSMRAQKRLRRRWMRLRWMRLRRRKATLGRPSICGTYMGLFSEEGAKGSLLRLTVTEAFCEARGKEEKWDE